jgi:hypothetical protein
VSHDCDILYDETPSHFEIFVLVCRIEMSILPLQTKIDFIENVVILSFDVPSPFTLTSNDDYTSSRIAWIRTQIDSIFPNHSDAEKNQLMFLSNTIPTLEDAKAELAVERQFLLQQGDFILYLTSLKKFSICRSTSTSSSTRYITFFFHSPFICLIL